MVKVIRNNGYIEVDDLGEAKIIRGKSHKVRRIRGVLRESETKMDDIGVKLLRRGIAASVMKKAGIRKWAAL